MESSLLEVDQGVLEAYEAMGVSTKSIIWHVMIREARPSIVLGLAIATIGLIGATAMAGLVGAGGLGDLAYRYGYLRYEADVMYVTVIMLIILVQGLQSIGNRLAAKNEERLAKYEEERTCLLLKNTFLFRTRTLTGSKGRNKR